MSDQRRRFLLAALAATMCGYTGSKTFAQDGPSMRASQDILVIGDSLSAEYGLKRGSGWVAIVAEKLEIEKYEGRIHNASISGDTTSGGLSRLPAALARHAPGIVILELGSNDALRGLSLQLTQRNLSSMVALALEAGARVLLVGMQIPPNYGRAYTEQFQELFPQVAQQHQTGLVPFLLEGMASDRSLFQTDGIHPNEAAQPILAENVWKRLQPMLLQQAEAGPA